MFKGGNLIVNGFSQDTIIKTPYGFKEINKIKVGDLVLGFNPTNNQTFTTKIVLVEKYFIDTLTRLRTIENKLICTNDTLLLKSNNTLLVLDDFSNKPVVKVFDDKKNKIKLNTIMSKVLFENNLEVISIKTESGTFIANNFLIQERRN